MHFIEIYYWKFSFDHKSNILRISKKKKIETKYESHTKTGHFFYKNTYFSKIRSTRKDNSEKRQWKRATYFHSLLDRPQKRTVIDCKTQTENRAQIDRGCIGNCKSYVHFKITYSKVRVALVRRRILKSRLALARKSAAILYNERQKDSGHFV